MTPRGLVALMRQTNTINLELWSPAYEIRLAKYAKRGFEVHVPFLEREKVAYNRVSSQYQKIYEATHSLCYSRSMTGISKNFLGVQ